MRSHACTLVSQPRPGEGSTGDLAEVIHCSGVLFLVFFMACLVRKHRTVFPVSCRLAGEGRGSKLEQSLSCSVDALQRTGVRRCVPPASHPSPTCLACFSLFTRLPLGAQDTSLLFTFSKWILEKDPELGVKVEEYHSCFLSLGPFHGRMQG